MFQQQVFPCFFLILILYFTTRRLFRPRLAPILHTNITARENGRIGQKHNVQIIKLITKDSIEEKILELQSKKKELFNKVVTEDGNILNKLTNEELLSLFNIEKQ